MDEELDIEFYPWGLDAAKYTQPPFSATRSVAQYWKDIPMFYNPKAKELIHNKTAKHGDLQASVKHCMPFFDAMTSGYQYPLQQDLYVLRDEEGLPTVEWDRSNKNLVPLTVRPTYELPTPHGHYNSHFSWQMWWGIKIPPGWSALITHPFNRPDLPFTTVSGLADFDSYPLPGNVSFHIHDNFEGIIQAGTPIFTILPVKRATWKSALNPDLFEPSNAMFEEKKTLPYGHYKKNFHEIKHYE